MVDQINISVIIPTYNRADVLGRAIRSALNQTLPPVEIIVIDDGSTDSTAELFNDFGDDVIYIKQSNNGPAKARNNGIKQSSGNYIAFLDSDDEWMPEKLEKQVEVIRGSGAEVVISDSIYFDPDKHALTMFSKTRFSDLLGRSDGKLLDCFSLLVEQNFIHLSSIVIKKSCFEKAGYFDESMKVAEDTDLWLRLSHYFPFGIINEPLTKRDDRADKLSGDRVKEYRGRIYLFNKFIRNTEGLSQSKKEEIKARRNFISGRLLNVTLHNSGAGAAFKALFRMNPASVFSKNFYRGYYWNQKEYRSSVKQLSS
ncbi:MAG: glycosyltransferase family 2 protein [Balneolaceae bacterium]|nr:glycosyltransferase family 2 protein [Balneolaceae bacterium]